MLHEMPRHNYVRCRGRVGVRRGLRARIDLHAPARPFCRGLCTRVGQSDASRRRYLEVSYLDTKYREASLLKETYLEESYIEALPHTSR